MYQTCFLMILLFSLFSNAITSVTDLLYRECVLQETEVFYNEVFYPPDSLIQQCPHPNFAWFTDDPDIQLVMGSAYNWYLEYHYGRSRMLKNGKLVLISNPFIFMIDENEDEKIIYCYVPMDEFGMYEDGGGQLFLERFDWDLQAFAITYVLDNEQWIEESITMPSRDEELIPGWGIGTQGMNGVSDWLIDMMDNDESYSADTDDYAQIYLKMNDMEDVVLLYYE